MYMTGASGRSPSGLPARTVARCPDYYLGRWQERHNWTTIHAYKLINRSKLLDLDLYLYLELECGPLGFSSHGSLHSHPPNHHTPQRLPNTRHETCTCMKNVRYNVRKVHRSMCALLAAGWWIQMMNSPLTCTLASFAFILFVHCSIVYFSTSSPLCFFLFQFLIFLFFSPLFCFAISSSQTHIRKMAPTNQYSNSRKHTQINRRWLLR